MAVVFLQETPVAGVCQCAHCRTQDSRTTKRNSSQSRIVRPCAIEIKPKIANKITMTTVKNNEPKSLTAPKGRPVDGESLRGAAHAPRGRWSNARNCELPLTRAIEPTGGPGGSLKTLPYATGYA
jgi:hypothetical protein